MDCPHCNKKEYCVVCTPELADDVRFCNTCFCGTWHKSGKCLRCHSDNSEEDIIFKNA